MPLALLIIGVVLIVSAVRDTQDDLFKLVKGDFTGQNNFLYWLLALVLVGSIGYASKLKSFSNALLALVVLAILLSHRGFFAMFMQQIGTGTANTSNTSTSNTGLQPLEGLSGLSGISV